MSNGKRVWSETPYDLDPFTSPIGHNAHLTIIGGRSKIGDWGYKFPLNPDLDIKETVTDIRSIIGI